ncbi:MAG TPA: chorismate mutase [Brevundimonas sp.]
MNSIELKLRRHRIDRIDAVLVRILAMRQRQVAHIALLKSGPDAVKDPQRVARVLARIRMAARRNGLDERVALPVWRELLERSAEAQQAQLRASGPCPVRLDEGQAAAGDRSRPPPGFGSMQAASAVREPS